MVADQNLITRTLTLDRYLAPATLKNALQSGSASTFKEIQKLKEDSLSPVAMVKGLKLWKVSTKLIITKLIITAGQHIPKRARSSLTNWDIEFEIVPMDLDNASVDDMA